MRQRIHDIMTTMGMTQTEFAGALGISPSSLSNIYNGRTSPTNNHVQAIHRRFPQINTNWLLFGDGEMMIHQGDNQVADTNRQELLVESVRPKKDPEPVSTVNVEGLPAQAIAKEITKFLDKPKRQITEIRVYYDDGTFETFGGHRD